MPAKARLYLIDGNSQMYRAYHAIRGLTGPDGRSTNAVYGFVTMLRKLLADHRPEFIAAAFDVAGPTFRSDVDADYKANRAAMPDDLVEQVPWVHESCEALGVPIVTREGYEADDVIGTIAPRAVAAGLEVVIVTGDKDLFQLVDASIQVYNPKDEGAWFDAAAVRAKLGAAPERVVDMLALMGDAIDNIKGVPGIGEKGARELIDRYGSLDGLLDGAAGVTQKRYREALLAHADDARRSRELLRIRTDVPVSFDLESFRYRGPSRDRCFELFSGLGFRSLLVEFAPTASTVARDYDLVRCRSDLERLVVELRERGRFALRVVGDDGAAMRANILGISISRDPHHARYLPLAHRHLTSGEQQDQDEALDLLRAVLEDASIAKIGHDLKFDTIVLARHGVALQGLEADSMLASYLIDATRPSHRLEDVALEQLFYKALSKDDVCGRGVKRQLLSQLPPDTVLDYAGERSDLALQLASELGPQLPDQGLETVWRELEMPLLPVLVAVERAGVRIDTAALQAQSRRLETELSGRQAKIFEAAGEEFNINSPKQLSEILFEKLQLPTLKRTGKTRAASTAVEVLEELALRHELPRQILEWRALQKLKGTYIDALPQLVHPDTGRVHTSFNQAVAATGRLSSSEPNLQNIPIRTELGREIRSAFVAEPGHLLISADYSQIELRVLAHLSEDETLIAAFRAGHDIHDQTALRVFGADSGLDAHELRRRAKIINYALLYGKTAFTLARDIGVSQQAAQEFIDAYFAGFPGVRGFIDATLAQARKAGVVRTMFGRRRLVPELASRNGQIRSAAERATINMPIQGTAADILKKAMIDLHHVLQERAGEGRPTGRIILTVHDELLLEVPEADATSIAEVAREHMEQAVTLLVPLTVDVGIGENWKVAKG